jgi:hypothetical protein
MPERDTRAEAPWPIVLHGHTGGPSAGIRGNRQIFCRTSERDIKVVIVGIDHRATPREVGTDFYGVFFQPEDPRLCVVRVRCERREADEIPQTRFCRKRRADGGDGLFIWLNAGSYGSV